MDFFLFILIFILRCTKDVESARSTMETNLLTNLTDDYQRDARPVKDPNGAINVSFGLEFIQLIKVDERNQNIKIKVSVRLRWHNELLFWNPSDWGNVTQVQIDPEVIWTPDIVLYNNADDAAEGNAAYKTKINVVSDGTNFWNSPASFISTCNIDVRAFPYDTQHCLLKFGSWTFDMTQIYLLEDPKQLIGKQFVNSSEWVIIDTVQTINTVKYDGGDNPFMDVTFTVTMMRKPLYYLFNVIAPCLVLVATVLFSFFLPPESGERIGLTLTVLLAFAVFLNMISGKLPRNSDTIPMLAKFFVTMMAESAFSLVTTCIVLVVHYRSGADLTPLPNWARSFFLIRLGSILRINQSSFKDQNGFVFPDGSRYDIYGRRYEYINTSGDKYELCNTLVNSKTYDRSPGDNSMVKSSSVTNANLKEVNKNRSRSTLNEILDELRVITETIRDQQQTDQVTEEWQLLGRILDRLFFIVFLLTVSISAASILMPVYLDRHNHDVVHK